VIFPVAIAIPQVPQKYHPAITVADITGYGFAHDRRTNYMKTMIHIVNIAVLNPPVSKVPDHMDDSYLTICFKNGNLESCPLQSRSCNHRAIT
jgi:hypothetical protein